MRRWTTNSPRWAVDTEWLSSQTHEAAIALVKPAATTNASEVGQVSSPPNGASITNAINAPSAADETDSELQRANELVSLHYDVKLKYLETGPDAELEKAAQDVEKVLRDLSRLKSKA